MEEAAKKAMNLIEQSAVFAREFIEKHGPQAWDSVLWVYTINGMHWLVWGIVFSLVTLGMMGYAAACHREYKKNPTYKKPVIGRYRKLLADGREDRSYDAKWEDRPTGEYVDMPDESRDVKRWIATGIAILFLLPTFLIMSNPWTYVQVFKPELSITRDVFNRITK